MLNFAVVEARELEAVSVDPFNVEYNELYVIDVISAAKVLPHDRLQVVVPGYGRGYFHCFARGWDMFQFPQGSVQIDWLQLDNVGAGPTYVVNNGDRINFTATLRVPSGTRCYAISGFTEAHIGIVLIPSGDTLEHIPGHDGWASENQSQWLR